MRSWLPALRIARREAAKAKGRSSLVLAMIGLPVAFLAFAAVTFDMFTLTAQEKLDRRLGTADAHIYWQDRVEVTQSPDGEDWGTLAEPDFAAGGDKPEDRKPPTMAEVLALLPPGSRVLALEEPTVKVRTPNGIGNANVKVGNVSDPMLRGIVTLLEGRAAKAPDEIVVNAAAAKWLNVGVGGTINAVQPDRAYRVTGLVEYPDDLLANLGLPEGSGQGSQWLVDSPAPIDWAYVKRLNKSGVVVTSREVVLNPPPDAPFSHSGPSQVGADQMALGVVMGGLAALEIILLAGPAFAVGARRRSRELALVAAAGGEPKQLRRIVLADGVVLGVAGAVAGLALGAVAAVVARPILEEYAAGVRAGGIRFFPLALAGIAGLAVITGMLAALVPALTAARQPVVQALSGRRGIVRSRKRWVFVGMALTAAGMAVAAIGATTSEEVPMMAGLVVAELGLVFVTPALIGLISRLGGRLPLAPRLALRDTARNRSSAAPAVSAVMAAVASAVTAGIVFSANQEQAIDEYSRSLPMGHVVVQHYAAAGQQALNWARAESMVRDALPDAVIHQYRDAQSLMPVTPPDQQCPYFALGRDPTEQEQQAARADWRCQRRSVSSAGAPVVVDDGAALAAFTGAEPERVAKAREVLARGGAVTTDAELVKDGRITLEFDDATRSFTVEGYYIGEYPGIYVMLSPKAEGVKTRVSGLMIATAGMPTRAQEERLDLLMSQLDSEVSVYVERGPMQSEDMTGLIFAAAAALIALIASGIATGLAAVDSRADLGTLAAVGAAPGVRRRLSLSQAGVISGVGALLGSATGLGAAAVLIMALNKFDERHLIVQTPPMPFLIPWDVVAMVLAVPVLAMAGAGLLTRSRLPIERRL